MSIILKVLVAHVPPNNADAYAFAEAAVRESAGLPPATRLVQFHDALIARYPCWSSGAYAAEQGRGACPWGDTPLIASFQGDAGVIAIDSADPAVVPFVLRRAGAFALTVVHEAAGKVYRPGTFSVVLSGVQKNVNLNAMVGKLMPLLKATREEVLAALNTPHVVLKCRLDYVTAKRFAATMDLIGCDCTIEKEVLVPVGGSIGAAVVPASDVMAAGRAGAAPAPAQAQVTSGPMGRFELADPGGKQSSNLSEEPSWIARVLGKGSGSRR